MSSGAAPSTSSIFPGATISGRFRIDRLLGRGSMGAVWLARHLTLNVDVAVKFIDAAFRNEKDHRNRFVHEAQSAARINSPHVVNVLDFGEDGGRLYIAMEYLVGEDLGSVLDRGPKLSMDVTGRIIAHACRGLAKAHQLGIAHRDIKPENLFLCGDAEEEGFVLKILDFGVAKTTERGASFTGTSAGQLIGSPAYMSPEQARGLPQIDGRSDLFSLAVVAYHCLTGTPPFSGDSLAELLFAIIGGDPEPVSKRASGLPPALDAWFARALDKDPTKRFGSAREMSVAFYAAIGNQPSSPDYASVNTAVATRISAAPAPMLKGSPNFRSSPRLSLPHALKLSASNRTATLGIAPALAQLGEVASVLGVGLVAPDLATVAHHSASDMPERLFGDVAQRISEALGTFENLESTAHQAVALYYESACVLARWVDGFWLVAIGTEQVHPTVLMVTLNTVTTKLLGLARQGGGATVAFRATLSGPTESTATAATAISAPPGPQDAVPDYVLSQLGQLFAKPLGALGRLAFQQRLKAGKPTYATYQDFAQRLGATIDDASEREAFLKSALCLLGDVLPTVAQAASPSSPFATRVEAPLPPVQAPAPPRPPIPARPAPPAALARPTEVAAAPPPSPPEPPPAPVKKKRIIIYRGQKKEVDE